MADVNRPWLSAGIRISSARKHELIKMSKFSTDPKFLLYIKNWGKVFKECLKCAKSLFYDSKIKYSINKTEMPWSIVKSIVNNPKTTEDF